MMKKVLISLFLTLAWMGAAFAQAPIIGALPYTLQNGQVADANQVMANFNTIVNSTNANAANGGINTNITALNALTTPITPAQGGTQLYTSGSASNVGNAYTVASPTPLGFSLVVGKSICWMPPATNTGPATLAVAGTAATAINRQTASGPVPLGGGEIVNGSMSCAIYDGGVYQCTNCTIPSLVPPGTTVDFSGVNAPAGWLLATGQAVSRTTYATLFAALNYSISATTNATTTVTISGGPFPVGYYVGGNNVTCNSYIVSSTSTTIVLNVAAGASGSTTLSVGPFHQGDCSTTFNLPNYTGRVLAAVDGSTYLTSTSCLNAATPGDKTAAPSNGCGEQTIALIAGNIPTLTSTVALGSLTSSGTVTSVNAETVSGSVTTPVQQYNTNYSTSSGGFVVPQAVSQAMSFSGATVGCSSSCGTYSGGVGGSANATYTNASPTAVLTVQPTALVYKIIKF